MVTALTATVAQAKSLGERSVAERVETTRAIMQDQLRKSLGLAEVPPPPCSDPLTAYTHPESVVRIVHSDLGSMLIGGVASLLTQMLHPAAMAGVAAFSHYREDPLGRLGRTAVFLGTTTFATREEALQAINHVRMIHERVHGVSSDGIAFDATDPDTLLFVHIAEVSSFLKAYQRYGSRPLSREECDQYVADLAPVALDLGAQGVPETMTELEACFERFLPELRMTKSAREARDFVVQGRGRRPRDLPGHFGVVAAAVDLLEPTVRRRLRIGLLPGTGRFVVQPLARITSSYLRWVTIPIEEAELIATTDGGGGSAAH